MKSIWTQEGQIQEFSPLSGDIKTDVCIIGGGIAGILTAYFLKKQGIHYVLVEKGRLAGGITKNTTAKITSQHGLIYQKIEKAYSLDAAALYYRANQEALAVYEALCRKIDCDFERRDNYVYTVDRPQKMEAEMRILEKIGAEAEYTDFIPLPLKTAGAVRFKNQAQFHPLKFLAHIVQGLNIYEQTQALSIDGTTVVTDKGRITAKRIIVATHFPFIDRHGLYFMKMYQERSYVIALKNAAQVDGMYIDESGNGLSFRNYGEYLLLGGGSHRTGKMGEKWERLSSFHKQQYPQANEAYRWAAQDCMTLDGIPYIGQYSKATPHIYVATGFNKWGMTSAMCAARLLTDFIRGKDNEYAALFHPSRSILHPQLLLNGIETAVNFIKPEPKRCTHLGCALKWNEEEQSWDCPCHGSRFTEQGKVITNPANRDLKE